MTELSISDVERRSGVEKRPEETITEYLHRVGDRTDLPERDVEAIVDHANRQRFGSETVPSSAPDPPIDDFLRAADSIDDTTEAETGTITRSSSHEHQREERLSEPSSLTVSLDEERNDDGGSRLRGLLVVIVGISLLGALAGGAGLINTDIASPPDVDIPESVTGVLESTDDEGSDTDVVTSAAEAEGTLEVTDMVVDGDDPEEEFIEVTNVGDVALDMSDWTVRDRAGDGAVDAGGVDPATFPDGFVLDPGDSVRLYTAPGEDTDDTIHWGYYDRQNWHPDGDVIIVLDGDGNEVLRYEYGSPP